MRTRRRGIPADLALDQESRSKAHFRGRKDAVRGSAYESGMGTHMCNLGRWRQRNQFKVSLSYMRLEKVRETQQTDLVIRMVLDNPWI